MAKAGKFKCRFVAMGLVVCLLLWGGSAFPALASQAYEAVVNNPVPTDRLNLRDAPNPKATSMGKYYNGVHVVVLDDTLGDWCEVSVAGVHGYMQKGFLYFGSDLSVVTPVMPTATVQNPNPADRLNLRERPTVVSASLAKYYNGTAVTILGVAGSWYHVSVDGKTGYMMSAFLATQGGTQPPAQTPAPTTPPGSQAGKAGTVVNPGATDRLNLRKSPSTSAQILGKYYTGTLVYITGESGSDWYKVQVGDRAGYMQKKYVALRDDARYVGKFATVHVPETNGKLTLYKSAAYTSSSLGKYPNGSVVEVLGTSGSFYRVRIYDKEGYMEKAGLLADGAKGKKELIALAFGVAQSNAISVHAYPDASSPSLGRYPKGTAMEILDYAGTWYYVAIRVSGNDSIPALGGKTVRGFVRGQYVEPYAADLHGKTYGVVYNNIDYDRLNLRQKPDTNAAILGKYVTGAQVEVLDTLDGRWYYVRVDGKAAYMSASFLRLVKEGRPGGI